MIRKSEDRLVRLSAAGTAFVLTLGAGAANAQTATRSLGKVFNSLQENITPLPNLIAYVAYIVGAAFGISGVMKLRQHVDNPGQTPLKDGLVRLLLAGALVAIPWLLSTMMGTLGGDQTSTVAVPTVATQ